MTQPVWNTQAGSLGVYPSNLPFLITLSATPVLPGTSLTYSLISGSLPTGTSLSPIAVTDLGIIAGTPATVYKETTNTFTIRATDDKGNIKDRTFSITISGTSNASFTTPEGLILTTQDSIWTDYQIQYNNPNPNNFTRIEVAQGLLPTGLQISPTGSIRGYATPPVSGDGSPTSRTFQFVLSLTTEQDGTVISVVYASYSIVISNQNLTNPPNTRKPVILNNRPRTIEPNPTDPYYGYYIPVNSTLLGTFQSDDNLAFKIIGYDFDNDVISYTFANLPLGLTGNNTTGWITGTPVLNNDSINQYAILVSVSKVSNPSISSGFLQFQLNIAKNVSETIVWITPNDLGTIFNGTISTLNVRAEASVPLKYRVLSGNFPPNTSFLDSGEIIGKIAQQPDTTFKRQNTTTTFSATVEAFSPAFPLITSTKTFTVTVLQEYSQVFETLYIKATPNLQDRQILRTLLDNNTLIPENVIYRPFDVYFGKARDVIYEHAFGIYASDIDQYLNAVTRNHYWRNITLGEIKTAIARDENGDIIYEVVYSEVIDNLQNPEGVSISSSVHWPVPISLNKGPWFTSVTNIYTSYSFNNWTTTGQPYFYTSLSPGSVRTLYPNSLYNMRNRVADVLGQEQDSRILPKWMTSQQLNGSTLGYTQAWVICYTKPGFSETIKNNINTNWPHKLNIINFEIDRFTVDKSATYDYDNNFVPPSWTGLPSANPVPDPLNSKDFYVLFPRQTILPNR